MTAVTDQQWTKGVYCEDDDYPEAPDYTPAPGADSDYTAADDEHEYEHDVRDEHDEPARVEYEESEPVDLGEGDAAGTALSGGDLDSGHGEPARRPARFDSKVAIGFAAAVLVTIVVALIAALTLYGEAPQPPAGDDSALTASVDRHPNRTAAPRPAAVATGDRPLPYTADAVGSCGPGSTSAQTMAGADPLSAFRCVRGGGDGQVIEIDLAKTYMITAISITPGWVGKDASGVSQWSQHRVVTTVQYLFNDTDRTLVTQDTKNVHGEAVQPIKRVLASKIRMLIRYTSRPPAQPESGTPPSQVPGGLPPGLTIAPMPDPLDGQHGQSDPVDAAFAISSLKIIGHEPL